MKYFLLLTIFVLSLSSCKEDFKPDLTAKYYNICSDCKALKSPCDTLFYIPVSIIGDRTRVLVSSYCGDNVREDTLNNYFFKYSVKKYNPKK